MGRRPGVRSVIKSEKYRWVCLQGMGVVGVFLMSEYRWVCLQGMGVVCVFLMSEYRWVCLQGVSESGRVCDELLYISKDRCVYKVCLH